MDAETLTPIHHKQHTHTHTHTHGCIPLSVGTKKKNRLCFLGSSFFSSLALLQNTERTTYLHDPYIPDMMEREREREKGRTTAKNNNMYTPPSFAFIFVAVQYSTPARFLARKENPGIPKREPSSASSHAFAIHTTVIIK